MKGLILRDLYDFPSKLTMIIMSAWFLVLGTPLAEYMNVDIILCVFMFLTVWCAFVRWSGELCESVDMTLPVTRAQLVSVRYIGALSVHLSVVILCAVGGIFFPGSGKWNLSEYLLLLIDSIMLGACAVLPMSRLFSSRGKETTLRDLAYILVVNLITDILWGVFKGAFFADTVTPVGFLCVIVIAAAMYALSWLYAVKAYQKLDLR